MWTFGFPEPEPFGYCGQRPGPGKFHGLNLACPVGETAASPGAAVADLPAPALRASATPFLRSAPWTSSAPRPWRPAETPRSPPAPPPCNAPRASADALALRLSSVRPPQTSSAHRPGWPAIKPLASLPFAIHSTRAKGRAGAGRAFARRRNPSTAPVPLASAVNRARHRHLACPALPGPAKKPAAPTPPKPARCCSSSCCPAHPAPVRPPPRASPSGSWSSSPVFAKAGWTSGFPVPEPCGYCGQRPEPGKFHGSNLACPSGSTAKFPSAAKGVRARWSVRAWPRVLLPACHAACCHSFYITRHSAKSPPPGAKAPFRVAFAEWALCTGPFGQMNGKTRKPRASPSAPRQAGANIVRTLFEGVRLAAHRCAKRRGVAVPCSAARRGQPLTGSLPRCHGPCLSTAAGSVRHSVSHGPCASPFARVAGPPSRHATGARRQGPRLPGASLPLATVGKGRASARQARSR